MPLPQDFIEGPPWTIKIARHIFPWLIWAAKHRCTVTYGGLDKEVVLRRIHKHVIEVVYGHPAGVVGNALAKIGNSLGQVIPPLNALVIEKVSQVPGYGCDSYIGSFLGRRFESEKCSLRDNRLIVEEVHQRIYDFPWDDVENYVRDQWKRFPELRPYKPCKGSVLFASLEALSASTAKAPTKESVVNRAAGGGEQEAHKRLKIFIAENPSLIGLPANSKSQIEYLFWSGDRADILFTVGNDLVIVEVKPACSPEADIYRGLHQCVKYKALIRAEQIIHGRIPNGKSILVLGRSVPENVRDHAIRLNVPWIDNIQVPAERPRKPTGKPTATIINATAVCGIHLSIV